MKKKFLLLSIIGIIFIWSCADDDYTAPEVLNVSEDTLLIGSTGAFYKIDVETSGNWNVSADKPWITYEKLATPKGNLPIWIDANDSTEFRESYLLINSGKLEHKIVVLQERKEQELIEVDDFSLVIKDIVANAEIEEISAMVDNSVETNVFINSEELQLPLEFELTLGTAEYIDYILLYAHPEGGKVTKCELFYTSEMQMLSGSEKSFESLGEVNVTYVDDVAKIYLPIAIYRPESIKVKITETEEGAFGCSELIIYQNKERQDLDVFTDQTYSELNEGITQLHLDQIADPLTKKIAEDILYGRYDVAARCIIYDAYQDPIALSEGLRITTYSRHDNPTGIWVEAEDSLIVFIDRPKGIVPTLEVVNWDEGASGITPEKIKTYSLVGGKNVFKIEMRGMVYVMYNTDNYLNAIPMKINILGGRVAGFFDIREHTDEDWPAILEKAEIAGYLDIMGRKSHWMFPLEQIKEHIQSPEEFVARFDKLMDIEHEFMGLYKYNRPIKNRLLFCHLKHDDEGYANASTYRTAYSINSAQVWLSKEGFMNNPWGVAHEAGHMHQTRPGLRWVGTSETTNNLHSNLVRMHFGFPSRIEADKLYEYVLEHQVVPRLPHALLDTEKNGFCKLPVFWQVHIYGKEVLGGTYVDFYKDLHERIRIEIPQETNGMHQLNFVRMCCELLERDMTDYFEDMGFLIPIDESIGDYDDAQMTITQEEIDALKEEIKVHNYPSCGAITYLKDSNTDLFKNPTNVIAGTVSVNGQTVRFIDWSGAVGYEVYVGDVRVSANHFPQFNVDAIDLTEAKYAAVQADGKRVFVQQNIN